MTVPFLDLQAAYLELKTEIDAAVSRVLGSGWYVLGPEVEAFEQEFAEYCGANHAIGVANGMEALHLALHALGVGPGDEVIVPSNTFIATWLAVSQCGATPVPVEPQEASFNLDPARIEAAITPRTKVLLPVHLYGQSADLDPILSLADRYGLRVLEDAAQAHGARYKGRRIGCHGDAVTWSFYPGKNLGAMGDGGAITTNSAETAERLRVLRNYGSRTKYLHDIKGFNSRLDPVQAAILRVKLRHLDEWNNRRKLIAMQYMQSLDGLGLTLPHTPDWADPVWHLFVVRHAQRDLMRSRLAEAGISTLIHYPVAPHRQPAYASQGAGERPLPIADAMAGSVLSLPIGPQQQAGQTSHVIEALVHVLRTSAPPAWGQ